MLDVYILVREKDTRQVNKQTIHKLSQESDIDMKEIEQGALIVIESGCHSDWMVKEDLLVELILDLRPKL